MQIILVKLLFGMCVIYSVASADVLIAPTDGNLLTATIQTNVTKDPNTQMYTYSYTVTNNTGSEQELWLFSVEISPDAEVFGSTAPQGWQFSKNISGNLVSWGAVEVGPLPADYVDDGREVPSAYNIKPGETLAGFSFQSLNAPGDARFYAQGFTQTPMVESESDIDTFNIVAKPFTDNSYADVTTSATAPIYEGEKKKKGDGGIKN